MNYAEFYAHYFPFWETLNSEDKDFLCRHSSLEYFEKEQAIHDNRICSGLYIVKKGQLRIYMLSEDGKEITLYRLGEGELCMLAASCVLQSITFDVYVEAERPSECYTIAGTAFGAVSDRVPEVKIFALETAVERFSDVMWVLQQIVFMRQDQRLAIFLLDECEEGNTVTMTHERIARHLGTAREVVTRMLKHFASDGLIEVTRKEIRILDKTKLRDVAL